MRRRCPDISGAAAHVRTYLALDATIVPAVERGSMEHGPDERALPGECPLCLAPVPIPSEPRAIADVLEVLAQHFAQACPAIAFPLPRPEAAVRPRPPSLVLA